MPSYRERMQAERERKRLRQRFHGHATLRGRTVPLYPITAEREYMRLTRRYVYAAQTIFKKGLPKLERAYKRGLRTDARFDDFQSAVDDVRQIILEMTAKLERVLELFGLEDQIYKIARMCKNISLREWFRCVKATFGIDMENGYFNGEFYQEILNPWIADSIARVKQFPGKAFGEVLEHVTDGVKNRAPLKEIMLGAILIFRKNTRQARNTARNSLGNLAAALTKKHQTDAGCASYVWQTSQDDRVRACHAALHGQTFRWDNPPEMWYITKGRGIVHTGRRCNPGEDYNCRCTARPVFSRDNINLPIRNAEEKGFQGGTIAQWQTSARVALRETVPQQSGRERR